LNSSHIEPCTDVTELKTTVSNARWALAAAAGIFCLIFSFFGWVANDNLAGIRSDLKEAKGMLQSNQLVIERIRADVDYLKSWKTDVDLRMRAR